MTSLLFNYSLFALQVAEALEKAVEGILEAGYRTPDIWSTGYTKVGCKKVGELLLEQVSQVPQLAR